LGKVERKKKVTMMRISMMKCGLLLSALIWITLVACGGGGGGGSGTSDTESDIIHSDDYTNRDITKVYTFRETMVDTTDGKNIQSEYTISYSYAQVATIPSKYGYSGAISGPYIVETIELNDVDKVFNYLSSSSIIISDDSTVFTNIDSSSSTGVIPPDWTVGTVYSKSSTEDLFNSASGLKVGTRSTEYTLKALGMETVTVPEGTFETVKTQESSTMTIAFVGGTEIMTSTWFSWYGKDLGFVKKVSNTMDAITIGSSTETLTSTATDELTNVSQ
jgi:hypothetical protein